MFKRLIIIVASVIAAKKIRRWSLSPHKTQNSVFKKLINQAKNTNFGLDHSFELINSYKDFKTLFHRDIKGKYDLVYFSNADKIIFSITLYPARLGWTKSSAVVYSGTLSPPSSSAIEEK